MAHVPRLYLPGLRGPGIVTLDGEQARRLGAVMRLRTGDAFLAFGGDDREWNAVMVSVERGRAIAELTSVAKQEAAPQRVVEMALAVVRPNRMDWAVEKCTEAGADVIRPFTSENAVRGGAEGRLERWQRLAVEAAEQCGRLTVPVVREPEPLATLIAQARGTLLFGDLSGVPWSEAARQLPAQGTITVFVGPEGDFSPGEIALLRGRGAIGARLSAYILRTETAAVVMTALLRSMDE